MLFQPRDLYDFTVARLAVLAASVGGQPARSYWDTAAANERVPNSYLWVPRAASTVSRGGDPTPQGWRTAFGVEQTCQVRCYGENHVVAWTMLANVVAILAAQLGANLSSVKANWSDFVADEERLGENGALLLGEITVRDDFVQRYVHVAPRNRPNPQTLAVLEAPNAQPTGFEIRWFTSPDGTTDGELLRVDAVTVPTP